MAKKRTAKPYWEMTTDELREATAEFDEELVIDRSRPLNAKERAWWKRAQKALKMAQNGTALIAIRMDAKLLHHCATLAKKKRISLDSLVEQGCRALLAAEGE
jgi:hypothetical protein